MVSAESPRKASMTGRASRSSRFQMMPISQGRGVPLSYIIGVKLCRATMTGLRPSSAIAVILLRMAR